ncbi:hypothetical protein ACRHK7_00360 [Weissella tructae]|uniref:hypothetical protein n=1 Tax=Weissella tructae TaxID=887702 RepID=UPI003D8C8A7B
MADNLDKLLVKHFSGALNIEISEREYAVTHPDVVDENNGGRAQNSYTNSVELNMIAIESDESLMELCRARDFIQSVFERQDEECRSVVSTFYRSREGRSVSWEYIAKAHKVDERTARRWRDRFKKQLIKKGHGKYLTDTNIFCPKHARFYV